MSLKKILANFKADIKQLHHYPACDYGEEFTVDYAKYWSKRRDRSGPIFSDWQKQRADMVLNIIEPGSTVIDLGCGDGAVLNYLKKKSGINGIGVDVDSEMIGRASTIGIAVIQGDLNDVNALRALPETDYILGFEIIEHMSCPERLIYHLIRKAKKCIILSVPNSGYYAHRLRLLCGRFPLQWLTHPGEHLRFWTVRDMKFWVNSMGLQLKKLELYEGLPVLNKLYPSLFAKGIVVVIKRNKE